MQNSPDSATQIPLWIPVVASLIGGGAMGAVITALITWYRNRRQPVGYEVEMIHIFRRGKNFPRLARLVVADHTGQEQTVDNLSLARIKLTNRGNQDIKEFTFGVTMEGNYRVVDLRMKEPDRHHVMKITIPNVNEPIVNPDFTLEPFNRGDAYSADIYFSYDEAPGPIKFSSPHPTRFVESSSAVNIETRLEKLQLYLYISMFALSGAFVLFIIRGLPEILRIIFRILQGSQP